MKQETTWLSDLKAASLHVEVGRQARARLDNLTKPPGSLGQMEDLVAKLAGITGKVCPVADQASILLFAADHGITAEGVSPYPSEVTAQMVMNFEREGAAINAIANSVGARLRVVDVGVASEGEFSKANNKKVRAGTRNFMQEPAMTEEEGLAAIRVGFDTAREEIERGAQLLALGEMGIGNTTTSSAITACLLGLEIEMVTGKGTGLDEAGWTSKVGVIKKALARRKPDPNNGLDVLFKVGGYEIAALIGAILGAATRGIPVILDGFITGAASLIAREIMPASKHFMIASHCSVEQGHQAQLDWLGLKPLIRWDLRLGEGSGAALVIPLLQAGCTVMQQMATFESAGVTKKG